MPRGGCAIHLLRIVYLGGLFLFLLLIYASMGTITSAGGVAYRMQRQSQLGQVFFLTFSMFCVISMGLIAPVLTSTAASVPSGWETRCPCCS